MGKSAVSFGLDLAAATAGCVVVLAAVVNITQRLERRKYLEILQREYGREKQTKAEKKITAAHGHDLKEPDGTELMGMKVEKVFLLELEDLRKLFPSSNTLNMMRMVTPESHQKQTHSPLLRWNSVAPTYAEPKKHSRAQNYNKIIGDRECVLGQVVPYGAEGTYAATVFLRAGPRYVAHSDVVVVIVYLTE